jgi:hypothetical protein
MMHLVAVVMLFQILAPQSNIASGTIVGSVTDEQGYAVTKTSVRAYRAGYDQNGNLMVVHESAKQPRGTQTNSKGEFTIAGLQPGEYFIAIEPGIFESDRLPDKRVPSTTYYPGTLDPAWAATVRVRESEESSVGNIRLLSARLATVRLRIVNSTGERPERRLVAWGMSSMRNPSLVAGQALLPGLTHAIQVEGDDVELTDLPPASYGFSVTLNTDNRAFVARTTIDVNETDVYREIEVRPSPPRVMGTVVLDDDNGSVAPLADVQLILVTDGSSSSVQGVSGSDGRFTVSRLTERNFRLRFMDLPDDAYVESASDGALDALLAPWRLTRDVDLLIVVKRKGAKVSGRVIDKDGNTISEALVVLVPDTRDASGHYFSTRSDTAGAFTIRGIAPGSYHLFAWRELEGAPYRNSDFMRRFEKDGVPVTLERALQVNRDVTVSVD